MDIHEFKRSPLVGSDRCQECGEVKTHVNHAYAVRADQLNANMIMHLHAIPYEQIQTIKGVALLLLCEKIAESQPPGNKVTAAQLVELWVRNAITVLIAEGVFDSNQVKPGVAQ